MDRYAIVENGIVVNVVLWDGIAEWRHADTAIKLPPDSDVCPGFSYDGAIFSAPPPYPQAQI